MRAYVDSGASREFRPSEAVPVYRGGGEGAFASLHQVKEAEDRVPYLAPGELLTTAFVRALAQGARSPGRSGNLSRQRPGPHSGPAGVVVAAAKAGDVFRRNGGRSAEAQRPRLPAPGARL